ncbi:unnamed protein product [Vicia faba]|uniref:TF-B3 domain-containing protein n=1 Tax=Vicia faba TaxID=3906 RepID=A0AAV0Z1J2_VICFA|nr:unnamed protein product [Vicia faba]
MSTEKLSVSLGRSTFDIIKDKVWRRLMMEFDYLDNTYGISGNDLCDDALYFESEECTWTKKVTSGKVIQKNMLRIPNNMIRMCLAMPQSSMELLDTDTGVSYQCELKQRKDIKGKFLANCWYDFSRQRRLKRGVVLSFYLRYPPATRLLVCVLNRSYVG